MSVITDIANKLFAKRGSGPSVPLGPIKELHEQAPDETKLVNFIREKIDQVRQESSRITLEQNYMRNVAYLLGYSGVTYDVTYKQFRSVDPKRKISRNRKNTNKILPTVQNRLARLTQSPPRFDVRPNSSATDDKDAARLGLEIVTDGLDRSRYTEKRQETLLMAMQGGCAYQQVLWDPCLGKPMIDPDSGEFLGYEGDYRIETMNCLEIFADPLAKTIDDANWIIKAKVRKLDYFKERYKERGEAVKEEQVWLISSINDMKSNGISGGNSGSSTQNQMKNSAIEIVYYEKRSKDYPQGRMVVSANGVLLEDKELPVGEYDIVKFDDIRVGGRYNPEAIITHLVPIQDRYSIIRDKIDRWVKTLLAGKWIVARGAELSQEAINDDTEVIYHTPVPNGSEPKAANIPQIPPYVYKEIEVIDNEFDRVVGLGEVSQGNMPSASIPAAGMAFLQEQDQTRIGVQTSANEVGYAKVGSLILKYVSRYYEMPRLLKLAGDGLEYAVKEFVGADLKDNHDVICVPGSTIPQSKVLRRQDLLNAYQMGLLGDPQDPKLRAKVLADLEYGDTAEMWKLQALKEAQFKRMLEFIEKGDEFNAIKRLSEFDDQGFHLQKMEEFRLSDKFWEMDEQKQKLFLYVMEWRLQALSSVQNPQIPQQQMLAEQMVKSQEEQFAQGGGGNVVPMQPQVDQMGNPIEPPMAEQPTPNVMPLRQGA